jgi:hypothetical protein
MADKNKKVTVKTLSEEIVDLKQQHTNEINVLKDKFTALEKYVIQNCRRTEYEN